MYMHTDQATQIHLTRPFQQLHRYKIRQSILLATATLASSFQLATVTTTFSFPWSIAIVVYGDDGLLWLVLEKQLTWVAQLLQGRHPPNQLIILDNFFRNVIGFGENFDI